MTPWLFLFVLATVLGLVSAGFLFAERRQQRDRIRQAVRGRCVRCGTKRQWPDLYLAPEGWVCRDRPCSSSRGAA